MADFKPVARAHTNLESVSLRETWKYLFPILGFSVFVKIFTNWTPGHLKRANAPEVLCSADIF
jgi:hypothetical protein